MKTPGISLTVGMSQGTQTPYVTANGRLGFLHASKRLDLGSQKGLIAALAGLLLVNAVKKTKASTTAKRVRKAKDVTPAAVPSLPSDLFKF